jgi:hypothetical protein
MSNILKVFKPYLFLLNQLFEIEKKVKKLEEQNSINRNIEKLKNYFEVEAIENEIEFQGFKVSGLYYVNPLGEGYNETRLDCEATISGDSYENLTIVDVIRPIVFAKSGSKQFIIQKALVIVESI